MKVIIEFDGRNGEKQSGKLLEDITAEHPEVDIEVRNIIKFDGVK